MKRIYSILLSIACLALVCCNNEQSEPPVTRITFSDKVEADYESASLTCMVSGNYTAQSLTLYYSTDADLKGARDISIRGNQGTFTVELHDLAIQTTYYYRYEVSNSIDKIADGEIRQFKTRDYTVPLVKTMDPEEIKGDGATLTGFVSDPCNKPIIEHGFYLGTSQENLEKRVVPNDVFSQYSDNQDLLEGVVFSFTFDDLEPATLYYCRAYAQTEVGEGQGEIRQFSTSSGVPEFSDVHVTSIGTNEASLSGKITSEGGLPIVERGFCYSLHVNPSVNDSRIVVEGSVGSFGGSITGLTPRTEYFVRMYAKNKAGVFYSDKISFLTLPPPVSSVFLNKTSLTLNKGESETLIATVIPEDASYSALTWTSTRNSVASVTSDGKVWANGEGYCEIIVQAGGKSAQCSVTVRAFEGVDLGLSVKWATFNLGASKPEETGAYFAWGETDPKTDYSWETYKWCQGTSTTLTKYNYNPEYGAVDELTVLERSDDPVCAMWGGKWRMPTHSEVGELLNECEWQRVYQNGRDGWIVTSKVNGNNIYIPKGGHMAGTQCSFDYTYYWTSTLYYELDSTSKPSNAIALVCFNGGDKGFMITSRYYGFLIRPVLE